jgi:hypothetical protein
MTYALVYALGGLTVYFWPQVKAGAVAAYDWIASKI